MARAEFQAWLGGEISQAGLKGAKIQVLQLTASKLPNIAEITASVRGEFEVGQLAKLVHSLEGSNKILSISYLDVLNNHRKRYRLEMTAYFRSPSDLVQLESAQ